MVIGGTCGLVTFFLQSCGSRAVSSYLPTWLWWATILAGLHVAQALAFRDLWKSNTEKTHKTAAAVENLERKAEKLEAKNVQLRSSRPILRQFLHVPHYQSLRTGREDLPFATEFITMATRIIAKPTFHFHFDKPIDEKTIAVEFSDISMEIDLGHRKHYHVQEGSVLVFTMFDAIFTPASELKVTAYSIENVRLVEVKVFERKNSSRAEELT